MATIIKRGPRQWQAKVRKKGYKQASRTFTTKARAERWAAITESEFERRVFVNTNLADSTTFDELADRYLTDVLENQKSMHEAPFRLKRLRKVFGEYSLTAVSPLLIGEYRENRLQEVSPASVRKELLLLRRVIEQSMKEWGYYLPHGNPVSSVRLPREPCGRDRRLRGSEEKDLLQSATEYGGEIRNIITLAIETGARRSEIANLRWDDVDLTSSVATLRDTKNGETRDIPLSAAATKVFRTIGRQLFGQVFRLKPSSISQAFARVCAMADINDLRFHDLRHEATSRFFELGLSLMEVAAITGHKDISMLRRYTHLRAKDLVKKLEGLRLG